MTKDLKSQITKNYSVISGIDAGSGISGIDHLYHNVYILPI